MSRAAFTLLLLAAAIRVVTAQPAAPDPLLDWMNRIAQTHLQAREDKIAAIRTIQDAEQRKQSVRKTFLSIIGGLPDSRGPLNARITGRLQADGYVIEKVIFESLPRFYVTANLYRPVSGGRHPGILLQAGHTQEGKPEGQRLAANLALKGFVVLAFDPLGQGEREQTWDPRVERALAGWSVPEHIQAGAQSLLVGQSVARYFIHDAMRALDYLVSRPEVDATRLGAAGCSGGGALTTFIGALDSRIKAVAPACFINSYRLLFAGPDPDSEMTPPRLLASGLDMADYVELSAPTPWLILATEGDYFTPPGARMVYEEARRWFRLYKAEDHVGLFVGSGSHGTPLETREAIYQWMIRWLQSEAVDFHEKPVHLFANHELLVTASGHVDDEPGSRKVYQLILDEYRANRRQGSVTEMRSRLRDLGIAPGGKARFATVMEESQTPGWTRRRVRFESEPGIEVRGTFYVPNSPGKKKGVLIVADKTRTYWIPSTTELAQRIAAMGSIALELEVRDAPGEGERPYVGNWQTNARADQIGLNLPVMRARDILGGVELLAAHPEVDSSSLRALARGVKGIWILLAAAVDPRISALWLDRTPYNLRAALEHPMNTDLFDAVIPGFALRWDLEDLVKSIEPRRVLWTDPTNWMSRPVPLGQRFRYRYNLGDDTDYHDDQENGFIKELIR